MNYIELSFHLAVVFAGIVTLVNWRWGLYLIVLLDVLRDPVRKLSEEQSVIFTLTVNSLWLAAFAAAYGESKAQMSSILQRHKMLGTVLNLVIFAILPGALLSVAMYRNGYLLAIIGAASYLGPCVGIMIGYVYLQNENQLWKLLKWYVFVNSIALISTVLEYQGIESPMFGGINMEWLRYRTGYTVKLITGIFRSPDVMGLHAAHVIMFSTLLLTRKGKKVSFVWVLAILFSSYCLLLCGRRKMIGIPIAFVIAMFWLQQRAGLIKPGAVFNAAIGGAAIIAVVIVATPDDVIDSEYTQYASTIATESVDRTRGSLIDTPLMTLKQSGVLGRGLGTATQGVYYVDSNARGAWQEDGIGRLFAEFGLIGVILLVFAGLLMIQVIFQAFDNAARSTQGFLAGLIAIVVANGASFIVSHQAYSGDPCTILFIAMMLGILFSAPSESPAAVQPNKAELPRYQISQPAS